MSVRRVLDNDMTSLLLATRHQTPTDWRAMTCFATVADTRKALGLEDLSAFEV